ncbi:MAG: hypothetical protein ACREJC_04270, partial [Tepidisphaeraceae bacterium]
MNLSRTAGAYALCGLLICLLVTTAEGAIFSDNFNRPDSPSVGNGWTNTSGNTGGNLAIVNNQVSFTTNVDGLSAGIC